MPVLDSRVIEDRRVNKEIQKLLSSIVTKQEQQDQVIKNLTELASQSSRLLNQISRDSQNQNDQKIVDIQREMSAVLSSLSRAIDKISQSNVDLKPLVETIQKNSISEQSLKAALNTQEITNSIKEVNNTIKTSSGKTWNFSVVRDNVGFIKEIKATQE